LVFEVWKKKRARKGEWEREAGCRGGVLRLRA